MVISDSSLKPVQGAKLAENDSFFCAMSALSLLARGSNDSHGHYKRQVKNIATVGTKLSAASCFRFFQLSLDQRNDIAKITLRTCTVSGDFSDDAPSGFMLHNCCILRGRTH